MPAAPTDFRLYHGNDLQMLAALLAAELAKPVMGGHLLDPDTILIPQPAMRQWLQKTLAETHAIAANLSFLTPGEFVRLALDANVPGATDAAVGTAVTLRWRLWAVLIQQSTLREKIFSPVQAVLDSDDRELAAWALAGELATAFEKYQAWRRDWLRRWDHGADREDWQAELWRRATRGLTHRGARLDAYLSPLEGEAAPAPVGLPPRVFAFACQNVSPDVLRVIASSARAGVLHFFFLSPVAGWWGDLLSVRERLRTAPEQVFADDENPLLRANGIAGRDFVRSLFSYEFVHPTWDKAIYVPPDPQTRTGLLHRLQRDLLARQPVPSASAASELLVFDDFIHIDRSLQVHACHTRLREVQVLHDQLRALLENDPTLQPREIAVLTPNIEHYAAHIAAVFGAADDATQHIPYAVSDRSALAAQPLLGAFQRLLALPSARFTVKEILELLGLPAIAQRFGLASTDFPALRRWLHAAGARWGLNAQHRAALDAPAEPAYTWAWALDRLLLGYASGDDRDIAGVAPWPQLEGSAINILDALLQGLRALARGQRSLANTHSANEWLVLLNQLLEDFFPERPHDLADQRALEILRSTIAAFEQQVNAAALGQPIAASVLRAWFQSALGADDPRQPFLSGGVCFGQMVPMRLIPFKVICLLGMNDGDYPRRDPIGSLNRLSAELGTLARQIGDRSIRDDDRGLFLQLFAAASDVFYLSYLGQDPRSGEILPPSVVVAELLDVASHYFIDAECVREQLTVMHPLQPFAAEAFGRGDRRRVSYHPGWRPAVTNGDTERIALPPFADDLPADVAASEYGTTIITRDSLYQTLGNPCKAFLRQRLNLRLPHADERLPDAEPFDNDDLHKHALSERIFKALISGDGIDREALYHRLLAEGRIAPGAAGKQEIDTLLTMLMGPAKTWRGWARETATSRPYQLAIGNYTLVGALEHSHDIGLLQFRAGKAHGKNRLGLGIDALVWSALGEIRPVHRLITEQGPLLITPIPQDAARDALHSLLALHAQAQDAPLPFMPKSAYAYFEKFAAGKDDELAWSAAHSEWENRHGFGEGQDTWVQLALRGNDPFADYDSEGAQRFRDITITIFAMMPGTSGSQETCDD